MKNLDARVSTLEGREVSFAEFIEALRSGRGSGMSRERYSAFLRGLSEAQLEEIIAVTWGADFLERDGLKVLSDERLKRLAAGEDPAEVLGLSPEEIAAIEARGVGLGAKEVVALEAKGALAP